MSRKNLWSLIKRSKRFNVRLYRKLKTLLVLTTSLNVLLALVIFYVYLKLPEPDFYSTYGETPPVKLTPMDQPNYTSEPLLPADEIHDSDVRTMPQ